MSALLTVAASATPETAVQTVAKPTPNESLMAIEERLQMLLDSEEFIDPADPNADKLRAMVAEEIAATLEAELTKVDGVANYLTWLETHEEFCGREIARLAARKAKFEKRRERVEGMVIGLLREHKERRLEGHTTFLALRKNPPSVEIVNEDEIPNEYKTAVITSEMQINKTMIKRCLQAQIDVPGTRLVTDKERLVRG